MTIDPRARRALAALLFLSAWALLNVGINLRYPAHVEEPTGWWLLPSLDVTVLLGAFAVAAWRRWRVPRAVTVGLAVFLLLARLYRISDGLIGQSYHRAINLSLDVPLLPEFARLMWSTLPRWKVLLVAGLLVTALALVTTIYHLALRHAQRFLADGRQRLLFAGLVAIAIVLAPLWPGTSPLHRGLFGKSIMPTLVEQGRLAISAGRLRRQKAAELAAMQARLRSLPAGLERLHGADVLVFFIESYGATVFHNPAFLDRLQPAFAAFESTLARHGYGVVSSWSDSSTYGGGSWLAHATFATGVRIGDGLEFAVLRQTEPGPQTMAGLFRKAGYRTVLVQPGTTRPWPEGEVRGFDRRYYAPDLGYDGPAFGWATMPDQHVLGFIHRHEIAPARGPLFVEYALVASHAPWTEQAPVLDDWASLGTGAVFRDQPRRTFSVEWSHLDRGGEAYVESLRYDFEVLKRYLAQLVTRDTLVILLGDHQPPGVSHGDPSRAVPVHVLSRDPRLVERFAAAGYARGMHPPPAGEVPAMERFLPDLMERLSGS